MIVTRSHHGPHMDRVFTEPFLFETRIAFADSPYPRAVRLLDHSGEAPHILQIGCRLSRNFLHRMGRFTRPLCFFVRSFYSRRWSARTRVFVIRLHGRFVLEPLAVVTRQFAFQRRQLGDRKSTRLNSSHTVISYAVFCLKKKKHTSELQSHSDLVCRLLLEKTKATIGPTATHSCSSTPSS